MNMTVDRIASIVFVRRGFDTETSIFPTLNTGMRRCVPLLSRWTALLVVGLHCYDERFFSTIESLENGSGRYINFIMP